MPSLLKLSGKTAVLVASSTELNLFLDIWVWVGTRYLVVSSPRLSSSGRASAARGVCRGAPSHRVIATSRHAPALQDRSDSTGATSPERLEVLRRRSLCSVNAGCLPGEPGWRACGDRRESGRVRGLGLTAVTMASNKSAHGLLLIIHMVI